LRFVEGKELEVSAFVLFEVKLELHKARLVLAVALQRLNTGIILPDETLQLGRTIGQLRGSL
jgi:hypothetical protein